MNKRKIFYGLVLILLGLFSLKNLFIIKTPHNNEPVQNKKPSLIVRHFNSSWFDKLIMLNEILEDRYNVVVDNNSENYDLALIGTFGEEEAKNPKAFKIFITGEAITPDLKKYDLSIGYNLINDPHYFRIPCNLMMYKEYYVDRQVCNPNKPYFACYLVTNGRYKDYGAVKLRDRLFHRLSLYKRVESAGSHLNNIGEKLPYEKTDEFLNKCKFVIAYENQDFPGYITEKPYNAYNAGAIPIYYSNSDAIKDINKNALIFAPDFKTEEDLVNYIIKVDQNDELYCNIWNEKLITNQDFNYNSFKEKLRAQLFKLMDEKKASE